MQVAGTVRLVRVGTLRTQASPSLVSTLPSPSMSIFGAEPPLPPRAPALPKLTIVSVLICVPAGMLSIELLNVAWHEKVTDWKAGMLLLGSSNQNMGLPR